MRGLTPILKVVLLGVKCYQTALHATEKSFMKRVNRCSKRLILRDCHSHPNLQQPWPWTVISHQHQSKTFHQQKDHNSMKAQIRVSIFLAIKYVFFLFIEFIGVTEVNKIIQVSGVEFCNISSIYTVLYVHHTQVRSLSITIYPSIPSISSHPSSHLSQLQQSPHNCPHPWVFFSFFAQSPPIRK